jgi:hypothetical protein
VSAVLVIVGSRFDEGAAALVGRWESDGAALMTCEDLSRPGWRHFSSDPSSSTAVVSGNIVPLSAIRGVLVRRPSIFPVELAHIADADREYVAAEMSSFLLWWLSALRCPVFNAPTPGCLSGPDWCASQWTHAAARAGLRTRPIRTSVPAALLTGESSETSDEQAIDPIDVTVVGERCFGAPDKAVAACPQNLARIAGVQFLCIRFDVGQTTPVFLEAQLFPARIQNEATEALREELLSAHVAKRNGNA